MKGKIALIILAIVGILMAPALSMPQDKGALTPSILECSFWQIT